jgi:hypothetical protein
MWAIIMVTTLALVSSCNISRLSDSNASNIGDTILLFKKDTLLKTSIAPAVLECRFSKSAQVKYNNGLTTMLVLENPAVITAPEGVYELYITAQPPHTAQLSSLQPGFVTVLDLYSFTAPGAKQSLESDISEHLQKLFLLKRKLPAVYISLHFDPVKLSDGSYSSEAGEIRFTGIRIEQIKK